MASPQTTCARCGTVILRMTAEITGGHCMPCARTLVPDAGFFRRREPDPVLNHTHPEEDVILSVFYHPGWSPDLTSWTIQISDDGQLRQEVHRDHRVKGPEGLQETVPLGDAGLSEVRELLEQCGSITFRDLGFLNNVDDAPWFDLVLPSHSAREWMRSR